MSQPGIQTAIQNSNGFMSDPAAQPPQACGEYAATGVVGNNLILLSNTTLPKPAHKVSRVGKWMATVLSCLDPGEVFIQMRVQRAVNMAQGIKLRTFSRIRQVMAAIKYAPPGTRGKVGDAGKGAFQFGSQTTELPPSTEMAWPVR